MIRRRSARLRSAWWLIDLDMNQIILEAGQRIAEVVRRLRQLKSVELKSYVSDIPIQMIDLDIPVGKEK